MRGLRSRSSSNKDDEALTWKCPYCGADNDNSAQVCDGCGDKRPETLAAQVFPEVENTQAEPESLDQSLATGDSEVEESEAEGELEVGGTVPTFQPTPQVTGQRYYLVFINSPAQSLIKSKVSIEFDLFPVITIGRNPENIVVIPDQEVSRKHAELTTDGTKVVLKDLKSSNGTYVYDGKEFLRVSDSVEVKPNNILKFGTSTIVRLVSE